MVNRVEYLSTTPIDVLLELIFSMKHQAYEREQVIFHSASVADSICFIESGLVEVSTTFEGNNFVIDTLGPGSIINHRALFLQDYMTVNMMAQTDAKLMFLSNE
jgi:CRP-like cAMP-binding protein